MIITYSPRGGGAYFTHSQLQRERDRETDRQTDRQRELAQTAQSVTRPDTTMCNMSRWDTRSYSSHYIHKFRASTKFAIYSWRELKTHDVESDETTTFTKPGCLAVGKAYTPSIIKKKKMALRISTSASFVLQRFTAVEEMNRKWVKKNNHPPTQQKKRKRKKEEEKNS